MINEMQRNRTRNGFTLIELLVVIMIIGALAALIGPNIFRHVAKANDVAARSQLEMLSAALDAYRLDTGAYPTTEQGLQSLWREPLLEPKPNGWSGPYMRKDIPADPWRHPYQYRSPAVESTWGFDLYSLGADAQPGGNAENSDIKAWQ